MSQTELASETIFEQFRTAVVDLIQHYSSEAPEISAETMPSKADDITSLVGVGGEFVTANISLTGTASSALSLCKDQPDDPCDWIGELGNQLAGRFKNKLEQYGIKTQLTTPAIITGRALSVSTPSTVHFSVVAATCGCHLMTRLNIELNPQLEIQVLNKSASMVEGAIELF